MRLGRVHQKKNQHRLLLSIVGLLAALTSCGANTSSNQTAIGTQSPGETQISEVADQPTPKESDAGILQKQSHVALAEELDNIIAPLPPEARQNILSNPIRFLSDLRRLLAHPQELLVLVDKKRSLPSDYAPQDLIQLSTLLDPRHLFREGLSLRSEAATALQRMMESANEEGIVLIAQSTYRSYTSQDAIYRQNVATLGQAAADRESARPGTSQHQLGLVLDFSPIEDAFANTPAYKWLKSHAIEFGFSLSFPEGPIGESITGYRFEPWHWRYIGIEASRQQALWYANSQQLMLEILFFHRERLQTLVNEWLR